ncbi:hypothetical protein [Sphingomonas mucosissima]|uniref:hypothetical protein n=1 Tax=Sphingomonas mucosissima TaxID=370959 RepID=UPI001124CE6E|nr:hypothetical protein [Sphingomonas mucosissima]
MSWLRSIFEPKAVEHWTSPGDKAAHRRERKRLSENHYNRAHAIAAWLLATLVAVNAATFATDLGKVHPEPFVAGIVLAILSGFASWQEAQDKTGLYYIESLPETAVTDHGRKLSRRWRWRGTALRLAARGLNWASLVAFLVGCWLST